MSRRVRVAVTVARAERPSGCQARGLPPERTLSQAAAGVGTRERGFSLSELVVVLGVTGLLIVSGLPYLITYLRTATLSAGVQEVRDALGRAKQLAITTRQNICVEVASNTTYRYRQVACNGTAWTGVGTDSSGFIRLQNRVRISNAGASPIFTALGTASTGATFTVTAPSGSTRAVTVAGGGRISSP